MAIASATNSKAEPDATNSGFWGDISSGVGEGFGTIGRVLLPVWVNKELELQSRDQLRSPTFNPRFSKRRIDSRNSLAGVPNQQILLYVGAAILVGVIVAKVL